MSYFSSFSSWISLLIFSPLGWHHFPLSPLALGGHHLSHSPLGWLSPIPSVITGYNSQWNHPTHYSQEGPVADHWIFNFLVQKNVLFSLFVGGVREIEMKKLRKLRLRLDSRRMSSRNSEVGTVKAKCRKFETARSIVSRIFDAPRMFENLDVNPVWRLGGLRLAIGDLLKAMKAVLPLWSSSKTV